jgi:hypothetical protein
MKAALESQVLDDTWRWSTSIVAMTGRPLGTKGAPPDVQDAHHHFHRPTSAMRPLHLEHVSPQVRQPQQAIAHILLDWCHPWPV